MSRTDRDLTVNIGREELVIRQRYETLSTANDVLLGVLFLVGSFLFLSPATTFDGTWLFIAGSVLMLIRPVIRLTRRIHLQRRGTNVTHESSMDF